VNFQLEPAFENGIQRLNDLGNAASSKRTAKTYDKFMNLPVPMRDSKTLLKLLRLHLQSDPPAAPILKVSLVAEPARPRAAQGGLFLPSSPDPEKLGLTVARLRNLIGDSNVGSPELLDTHRADEFRMACFFPSGAASNPHKNKKTIPNEAQPAAPPEAPNEQRPLTALRIFRPALPANVEMHGEYPARVSFSGLRARVTAVSGPWRTSGDWWRDNAWHQDEWDLELRFDAAADRGHPKKKANAKGLRISQDGVYRICFDSIRQDWFVRGVYD
jgi:protein ImuB